MSDLTGLYGEAETDDAADDSATDTLAGALYANASESETQAEEGAGLTEALYPDQDEEAQNAELSNEDVFNRPDDPLIVQFRDFANTEDMDDGEKQTLARYLDKFQEKQQQDIAEAEALWQDQLTHDFGPMYESQVNAAKKLIHDHDPDGEFKDLLNRTRGGSHPAVVKFMAQVAKKLGY